MTNLVSNIKTQFEANPVFVVSSKQTYDTWLIFCMLAASLAY
jgi:hypothetical protein